MKKTLIAFGLSVLFTASCFGATMVNPPDRPCDHIRYLRGRFVNSLTNRLMKQECIKFRRLKSSTAEEKKEQKAVPEKKIIKRTKRTKTKKLSSPKKSNIQIIKEIKEIMKEITILQGKIGRLFNLLRYEK